MTSMTKAFTLIEVLVSVVILAIVGTGLLQISTNSKNSFIFLKEKSEFDRLASIAFIHNNIKFQHKDMTLFDFLRDDYDDIDDTLRQYLKKIKVTYDQEEVSTLDPLGEGDIDEQNLSESDRIDSGQNLTLVYDKITIYKDEKSAYLYKIYIPLAGN